MNEITKKAPVVAISGSRRRDVVTDDDYEFVAELQAATLKAQKAEREALYRLRSRLDAGIDQGRRYFLDADLGIVRSRRKESAG